MTRLRLVAFAMPIFFLAACATEPPAGASPSSPVASPEPDAGEAASVPAVPGETVDAPTGAVGTRSAAPVPGTPGAQLAQVFEAYFEDALRMHPVFATYIGDHRYDDQLPNFIGPEYRAERRAMTERYLASVRAIDPTQLSAADRISWEIFVRDRAQELASERFPDHLLPINQSDSLLTAMPALGSGTNAQPFANARDYDNWLKRLDGLVVWVDQAIVNMREGMATGVVQPRPVVDKVLLQLDLMVVDRPEDSPFYMPVRALPDSLSAAERERITAAYVAAIRDEIVPACRRLRDFMRDEYRPKARTSVGWSALPDGAAWYADYVKQHTTTDMTPAEIHQLGLSEVARVLGEMDAVRRQVGFQGDLQAFFTHIETSPQFYFTKGADLLAGYKVIKQRIDAALPKLFSVFPKADYEVREVEAFRAKSAPGAFYQQPSADGSRPGIFYVNTYDLKSQPKFGMETLSLHEASPGHHFQTAIQQELEDLPRFRRFGGDYTAYSEGWGLYAEYLGKELGLFTDPYQWFGRLNDEQLRAMRLVVDTGLHAKGWSREQAIQYMLDNSTLAPSDVESEVERYIVWPGQALGYKVGDLRIQALRRHAEAELGPKFDVRDFHREVLSDGGVPLDVLAAKIDRWIAAKR